MKKVFILLFIIIFPLNVYAFETCELTEEFVNYTKNKEAYFDIPQICESNVNYTKLNKASLSDSYYSFKDEGYVTSVKNQYTTNLCWAFSALGSLEAQAKKVLNKEYDFSEKHVDYRITYQSYLNGEVNENGIKRPLNGGGNDLFSATYFFNLYGPISEDDMKFDGTMEQIDKNSMPNKNALVTIDTYRSDYYKQIKCDYNSINDMKNKILEYGSVDVAIYVLNIDLDFKDGLYFINKRTNGVTNHQVIVVGWDDTIPASKFNGATKDGAFIAKNSWGTTFGNEGYFYISYDDMTVCKYQSIYGGVSENYYTSVDTPSHVLASYINPMGVKEITNAYPVKNNEIKYIDKVSLEVDDNTDYEVYLSRGDYKDDKTWVKLGEGHNDKYGVISIHFDEQVVNGDYTIITKYKVSKGSVRVPCAMHSDDYEMFSTINYDDVYYYNSYSNKWENYKDIKVDLNPIYLSDLVPVIFVYSYSKAINVNIDLNTNYLYEFGGNHINYKVTSDKNISIDIKVLDSNNKDVTNLFNISKELITVKNTVSVGQYTLIFSYGSNEIKKDIIVKKVLNNLNYTINDGNLILSLGNKTSLSIDEFNNNLNVFGYLKDDTKIENLKGNIKTNSYLEINNNYFKIIVIGDVNGDGNINSGDLFGLRKHLLGTKLSSSYLIAADLNNDSVINSGDLFQARRILLS